MPKRCWIVRQPMRSIWWVQLLKIIGGKHKRRDGYALTDFSIDWEHEQARCPQGQMSSSWTPTRTRNQEVIKIRFGYATCGACPVRAQCTQSKQRTLTVRRHEAYLALEASRQREQTEEFRR